jgi:hypothetical protein
MMQLLPPRPDTTYKHSSTQYYFISINDKKKRDMELWSVSIQLKQNQSLKNGYHIQIVTEFTIVSNQPNFSKRFNKTENFIKAERKNN